ncbi:hypothetical protein BCR39DRAFT_508787, partial [Naematelia encephala]
MPGKPSAQIPAKTTGLSPAEFQARFDRYATRWIDTQLDTDPVFATKESLNAVEKSIGQSFQPYDHASHILFPTIASRFGLSRFVPTAPVLVASHALQCTVGTIKANCHRSCLPAFLYTCPRVSCSNCEARGLPTLIWQFSIRFSPSAHGPLTKLHPMACWICCSKGLTGCSVTENSLSEANDIPDDSPLISDKSDTGTDVPHRLPNHTPLARTSSHAGFQLPTGKRRTFSPSPNLKDASPPLPMPVKPVLRIGPAYLNGLHANAQARLLEPPPTPPVISKTAAYRPPDVLTESKPTLKDGSHHASPAQRTEAHHLPANNTAVDSDAQHVPGEPSDQRVLPDQSVFDGLRSDIEARFNDIFESARQHQQQMTEAASNSTALLNRLFSRCEDLERTARRDRDEINTVRAERDHKFASLRTMDTILVRYIKDRNEKQKIGEELRTKVAFLEKRIQEADSLQLVIDERMSLAVFERDRVNKECVQLRAAADAAVKQTARAEEALLDAFDEVDEVESRSSELETQVVELKAQILELKRMVKV